MKRLLFLMISLSTGYSLSAMHIDQVCLEKVDKIIRLPTGKRLTVHTWQRSSDAPVKSKINCEYCDKEFSKNYIYSHQQYYCSQNPDRRKVAARDTACRYCSRLFAASFIMVHQKRDCSKRPRIKSVIAQEPNKMSLKYILNESES